MTEREELTQEVTKFFEGKTIMFGTQYTPGHTIIDPAKFMEVHLRILQSEIAYRFWKLAFQRLNDLRMSIVNKTFEIVELKDPIVYVPPFPPVKKPDKLAEERPVQEPIKRNPLVLDPAPVKKAETKKKTQPPTQTPPQTLF